MLVAAGAMFAGGWAGAQSAPACDRACLLRPADTYPAALVAHDPRKLSLAPDAASQQVGTIAVLRNAEKKPVRASLRPNMARGRMVAAEHLVGDRPGEEPIADLQRSRPAAPAPRTAPATLQLAATAGDRRRIPPLSAFEEKIGFTRAVRAGNTIHVSGTTAVMPDGTIPADAGAQADRCFAEIVRYIRELGGEASDVVRVRMFVTNIGDADAVSAAFSRALKGARPTGTLVAVAALARPEWKVEIEAEAIVGP